LYSASNLEEFFMRYSRLLAPVVAAAFLASGASTAWASGDIESPDVVDVTDTTVMIDPSQEVDGDEPPVFSTGGPIWLGGSGGVSPAAISCDGYKGTWYTTSNVAKVKKITHAAKYSNFTSSNATATYSSVHQTTLSAGITLTAGASAEAGIILSKLATSASVSLAANGSKTTSSNIGISATIKPKKFVVVAAGNMNVTGNWVKNVCSSGTSGVVAAAKGTSRSFAIRETTAIQCDLSAPAGSLAALAKSRYC
jgi:hypothetical protein